MGEDWRCIACIDGRHKECDPLTFWCECPVELLQEARKRDA